MASEKMGIKVERNPPESRLTELGVRNWQLWPNTVPPIKFSWTMNVKEKSYFVQGKVRVYPAAGTHTDDGDEYVEVSKGDLVEFPKGLKCTWDVSEPIERHFIHYLDE